MTNETFKAQTENLKERGKELVAQGNQRQVVFRNKDGSTLFQTNLTILAVVALVIILSGVTVPFAIVGGAIALFMGIRVELVNPEA